MVGAKHSVATALKRVVRAHSRSSNHATAAQPNNVRFGKVAFGFYFYYQKPLKAESRYCIRWHDPRLVGSSIAQLK